MVRTITVAVLAAGAALAAPLAATAEPGTPAARLGAAHPPLAWAQYYPPGYYAPGYYPPGYYRGPTSGEVAAGVVGGLAAGAIAAGAAAAATGAAAAAALTPEMIAYCSRRYRSFDPSTGTYMTRGGQRVPCR